MRAKGRVTMHQEAPYPEELAELVSNMTYRRGWNFSLEHKDRGQGSAGLTFVIRTLGYNTYHLDRGETYAVFHYFPVPPAAYNRQSWQRWIFDRLVEVETQKVPTSSHGAQRTPCLARSF